MNEDAQRQGASEWRSDRLLLPAEAAKELGVSVNTLSRWADLGLIAPVRTLGGHRRYPVSEVQSARRGR